FKCRASWLRVLRMCVQRTPSWLSQLRVERNLRIQQSRNRTAGLRALGCLLELRLVRIRDVDRRVEVTRGHGERVADLLQRHRRGRIDGLRGHPRVAENNDSAIEKHAA